jgi:outer membrane protein, heavy metal efflux system
MKKYLVLLSILFVNIVINAQSVDSLITEGLKNNPQLRSLNHKIKSAEFKADAMDSYPAPTLGIEFSQVPTSSADIFNQSLSQNLSVSQMFMLGGKISAMTEAEKKNVSVVARDFDSYKSALIMQIKMSYFSIWMLERKIEIQEQNIALIKELSKSLEVMYQVNKANQADLLTIQSELASNEVQLVSVKNDKSSEIIKMNKLLGRALDSKDIITLKDLPVNKLELDENNLEELVSSENPSLKKMDDMEAMNRSEITANNKELIPDLMVQAMIMRMPKGMLVTTKTDPMMINGMGETEYMYSLMASVTLPFAPWSSGKIISKEAALLENIKGIKEEKNDMKREMISQLKTLINKARSNYESINLYSEKVIPLYQKTADAQTSAYLNKLANINSVIDTYKMLLMNKMNLFMSQADYEMTLAEIEMMTGRQTFKN